MSVQYSCSHLEDPHPPAPACYPSSSTSYHPLPNLYFCEECDAVRCNICASVEIASYFCPNCLFDVPSANVRADRNRCARNCFSCPMCESSLAVQATDRYTDTGAVESGPPYALACPGCKWSSREIGWEFEKPTSLAAQVQRLSKQGEIVQAEFDALRDHLASYISNTAPSSASHGASRLKPGKSKQPTRHISHLTQMAAKALGKDAAGVARQTKRREFEKGKERAAWDELADYEAKKSWKGASVLGSIDNGEASDARADLQMIWGKAWAANSKHGHASTLLPERIKLEAKLTKRCPHPNCRHLLIQPDTKSTRFKIKMVAMNYLPSIEIGRRRRRGGGEGLDSVGGDISAEELERRRRERRKTRPAGMDEDEPLNTPLRAGSVYTYQLAFVNPLYDPIQIRLTPSTQRNPHATCSVYVPVPHFTVNALKDAWAYDDDEEAEHGSEEASEESGSVVSGATRSTSTAAGTLGKKSRLSVLGNLGMGGDKRKRDHGVEKRGNMSKVGLEVEVLPNAQGPVVFDLEVRYTYRADEEGEGEEGKGKEGYKTFTFWVRIDAGQVQA